MMWRLYIVMRIAVVTWEMHKQNSTNRDTDWTNLSCDLQCKLALALLTSYLWMKVCILFCLFVKICNHSERRGEPVSPAHCKR